MGCASSHSVRNTQKTVADLQKTIDQMKSHIDTIDQLRLRIDTQAAQIESQNVAVQIVETRHQALAKQFMVQVSEHVSLCADFMTFIEIARENEQVPKEIMVRVECLESKIASGIKNELNKVQEQLHNLESSVLLDESDAQPSALDIASELQDVHKKVFDLEMQLFSDASVDADNTQSSGYNAVEQGGQIETDDHSDGNASEAALETLFMRMSPSLNRSASSTHDYDIAGLLDFALLEPEDAFEAEFSSITARARRHAQQMKPPMCYPPGFDESKGSFPVFPSTPISSGKEQNPVEHVQLHVASRRNVHVVSKFFGGSKSQSFGVKQKQINDLDSVDSS
jgi:hypothetical protein